MHLNRMALFQDKYVPLLLIALFLISGIFVWRAYLKEREEGFYGLKSKFKGAVSKVKKAGSAASNAVKNPKETARKLIIKALEKAYKTVVPKLEEKIAKSDDIKKGVYNMLKEAVIVGFNLYRAGENKKKVAIAALEASYKASPALVTAVLATRSEKDKAMVSSVKSGMDAYKAMKAEDAIKNLSQPFSESVIRNMRKTESTTPTTEDKLATAMAQGGFNKPAPTVLAKLQGMSLEQQAQFLYSKTGNAGVFNTLAM